MKELQYLYRLAKHSHSKYKFAAMLYNVNTKQTIIAKNCVEELKDPTAHAEIMVLRKFWKVPNRNNYEWIIVSTGEPCPMCLTAIAWSGIKQVRYIDDFSIANLDGHKFDRSAIETNKTLSLGLQIEKITIEREDNNV